MSGALRLKRFITGAAAEKLSALREQTLLLKQQNDLLRGQLSELQKIAYESKRTRDVSENIRGVVMAPIRREIADVVQAKQLGFMESVIALRDERKSLARFGDGEFRLMYRREHKLKFHGNSPELMDALVNVMTRPSCNTLIGMPQVFLGVHWSIVMAETWHFVGPLAATQERFANSHITRPIFFEQYGQDAVDVWRSVWESRNVTVVTGQGSRFELIPELFGNVGRVTEVFSTPTDAFLDLDRLIEEILDIGDDLVLLSLGPAATVAADRLAERGVQALDIGHLSSSFANVINGAPLPEHVPPIRSTR